MLKNGPKDKSERALEKPLENREEFAKGGYAKWAKKFDPNFQNKPTIGTPTISGPSQPSKPAGETTLHDGDTDVVVSNLSGPQTPPLGTMGVEREHAAPCINPSCKSFGKSHPNCLCYAGPGGTSLENSHFAQGGCVGAHNEKCEHHATEEETHNHNMILSNPQMALDSAAIHQGLLGLLTKVGKSKSENPHKHAEDYVQSVKKGYKSLMNHTSNLFTPQHFPADKDARENLKNHIQSLSEKPEQLLDVGGDMGAFLPSHAVTLAAKAGTAVTHLQGLRPQHHKDNPLDEPMPADKMKAAHYDRALDIAQNPMHVLQHTKDGTLVPSDVQTLNAIYPALYKTMVSQVSEALIEAKSKNLEIPYKQKLALSLFLGTTLDKTMTSQAMQAIMQSQGPQQAQQQKQAQPKRATNTEMKQINKVDSLYESPSERRESKR